MIATVRLGAGGDGRWRRAAGFLPDETPPADGKAVWSRRRDRGAKPGGSDPTRRRWQETPFTGESTV